MTIETLHTGDLKIEAYSLADLLQEVQEGTLRGFRLDYTDNATYPFGSGSYFSVGMVKPKNKAVKESLQGSEGVKESLEGAEAGQGTTKVLEALVEPPVGLAEGSVETKGKPGRKKQG